MAEMGEYLVGAYLREIIGCEIIVYNQHLSRSKGEFAELDVLGIDATSQTAYFCEVTTHLDGVLYSKGGKDNSFDKITSKFRAAKGYADKAFPQIGKRYMFWAPRIRSGLLKQMQGIGPELGITIEWIVQSEYSKKIQELRERAKTDRRNTGDPFYRVLQILENAVPIKR